MSLWNPPVSQVHSTRTHFYQWVLGILTHILILMQQALSLLHSPVFCLLCFFYADIVHLKHLEGSLIISNFLKGTYHLINLDCFFSVFTIHKLYTLAFCHLIFIWLLSCSLFLWNSAMLLHIKMVSSSSCVILVVFLSMNILHSVLLFVIFVMKNAVINILAHVCW